MSTTVTIDGETIGRLRDRAGQQPEAFRSALSTRVDGVEPAYAEFRVSVALDSHTIEMVRGDESHLTLTDANGEVIAECDLVCTAVGLEDRRDKDVTVSVRTHKLKAG